MRQTKETSLNRPYYFVPARGIFESTVSPVIGSINFILLAVPIFVINFLQVLTLLVLPFSSKVFRYLNRIFANYWWGSVVFMAERIYRMKYVFTGDKLVHRENVIAYSNHQGMIDIPTLMPLAWRMSRLGDLKFFVKDILKYAPGPGWAMLFIGCIFVKRNWYADKENIDRIFARFKENEVPVWLMSFLEGTRLTKKKLKASQDFARSRNMKVLKHVMIPRTKGFVGSVIGLRDHVTAVYDFTIGYPDGIPSLWTMMKIHPKEFHIHTRRFPIESLPTDPDDLTEWISKRYEEKDDLLDEFYKTGKFPGAEINHPYEFFVKPSQPLNN